MNTKKHTARAAGDLDLSFGRNGLVELPDPSFPGRLLAISAIVVDPAAAAGQRIYVGAYETLGSVAENGYVVRLLADGQVDTSFGNQGYVLLPRGNPKIHDAVILEDFVFHDSGKEITCFGSVIGWPEGNFYSYYSAAVRITSAGVIDESFGECGLAIYWTPSLEDKKHKKDFTHSRPDGSREALASSRNDVQGDGAHGASGSASLVDGKILFLARGRASANVSYLARINLDGSLDQTFGPGGLIMVTDPVATPPRVVNCWGYDVDRSGGIVAVGRVTASGEGIACRYDSQGNRDQAFGDGGVVRFPAGGGYTSFYPRSVKALDDGRLILQIAAFPSAPGNPPPQFPAVVKLLRNGERDPAFNHGEPVTVDLRPFIYAVSIMALDAATRIVIAGFRMGNGLTEGCISRLEPAGMLDQGFGVEGTQEYEALQPFFSVLAIQNRVNILIRMGGNGPDRIGRFIG